MRSSASYSPFSLCTVLLLVACGHVSDEPFFATVDPDGTAAPRADRAQDDGGLGSDDVGDGYEKEPDTKTCGENACSAGEACSNGECTNEVENGSCDSAPAGSGSVGDFAKAIGLCSSVVSAAYTNGYLSNSAPSANQHGILPKFGDVIRPREGSMLGVLSTGHAREFNGSPGTVFTSSATWSTAGDAPPGYPKASVGCPSATDINDVSALRLRLKAPTGATSFRFDFNFFSSEWPRYTCSKFNDAFVAILSAKSFNGGVPDNIATDTSGAPINVNSSAFNRCTPNAKIGCDGSKTLTATCAAGPNELNGTGFGVIDIGCDFYSRVTQGGSTGWLTTSSPIQSGEEFELTFMIWDTGDQALDSTVLLDNFRWMNGTTVLPAIR